MPQYKCAACRTRLRTANRSAASVTELCPQCGSSLEPVDDLAEMIGFRSIASADASVGVDEPIAQRVGDLAAHRARRARELPSEESSGPFDDPGAAAVAVSIAYRDR